MTIEDLTRFLAWCSLVNMVFLFLWWAGFVAARDRIYALHTRWFRLSEERFDAVHYSGMALWKMLFLVLNLVPYLVLRLAF